MTYSTTVHKGISKPQPTEPLEYPEWTVNFTENI